MAKRLAEQTLVITGASSGIGLSAAEQAAAAGARVVIVSRDAEALATIARRLEQAHAAQVLPVAADVAVRAEVEEVARAALQRFGGFDTWINNAGVGLIGSVLDAWDEPSARRLMDTNFWGVVNGSLVAVAHLRHKGGTLVNMASITADHAVPLQSIYSASKHAVKGFTDGLRQELLAVNAPVAVVLAKPACVATPLIEHVAHPPGRHPRLVSPLYDPRDAARALLAAAEHPRREIEIGGAAALNAVASAFAPGLMETGAPVLVARQWRDERSAGSAGNLFAPSRDSHGRTVGRHPGQRVVPALYNRLTGPVQSAAALAVGGLALGALMAARLLARGGPGR